MYGVETLGVVTQRTGGAAGGGGRRGGARGAGTQKRWEKWREEKRLAEMAVLIAIN